jgi:hypothetical protein
MGVQPISSADLFAAGFSRSCFYAQDMPTDIHQSAQLAVRIDCCCAGFAQQMNDGCSGARAHRRKPHHPR